jgi:GT2 family glycosyltransferase
MKPSAPQIPDAAGISVIVCAYTEKRWDDLRNALESLRTQTRKPDQIIVVIDHNEALYERAHTAYSVAMPDVVLLRNVHERGLSGARNSGIAHAAHEIIAFMDEDAAAAPTWIETLLRAYTDTVVIGVGGSIIPIWDSKQPRWFPPEFYWVVGCTYKGMPDSPAPVRNLIGCNMSFRREVFDHIGNFREGIGRVDTLPVGCEETELCIRIQQGTRGRVLLYDPGVVVHHRVPDSRGTWSYFLSRCYSEGISKALISRTIGTKDALSNERSYTLKTLPNGVLRGFADVFKGDVAGIARALAIGSGLFTTALGYLVGKLRTKKKKAQAAPKPATA